MFSCILGSLSLNHKRPPPYQQAPWKDCMKLPLLRAANKLKHPDCQVWSWKFAGSVGPCAHLLSATNLDKINLALSVEASAVTDPINGEKQVLANHVLPNRQYQTSIFSKHYILFELILLFGIWSLIYWSVFTFIFEILHQDLGKNNKLLLIMKHFTSHMLMLQCNKSGSIHYYTTVNIFRQNIWH